MNIVISILALNFIIIIHELGHYWVAKMHGIKVNQFSLFFGPKILSIQRGETKFSLGIIPVGAFVLMEGEEKSSESSRAFNNKPLWVRGAVIAAGPFMNFLTALVFITIVFSFSGFNTNVISEIQKGSPAYNAGIREGDKILKYDNKRVYQMSDLITFLYVAKGKPTEIELQRQNQRIKQTIVPDVIPKDRYLLGFIPEESYGQNSNVVASVIKGSSAEAVGLQTGDRIVKLDGTPVIVREDINRILTKNGGKAVDVTVVRNEDTKILPNIVPKKESSAQEQYSIGIESKWEKGTPIAAVKQSFIYTYSNVRNIVLTLSWLFTGKLSVGQLTGPVGIVNTISDVVQQSPTIATIIINLLSVCAYISIAVGATNLIPFPALDGGRLVTIVFGMIRGREVSPEKEAYISMVGFLVLIALGVYTIVNDIIRLTPF